MEVEAVLRFWELARRNALDVCIDGGWAVDALLGEQTRPHNDLDIALPAARVPALRSLLTERGFQEIPQPDSWEHNFVLRAANGETLDVHSYELHPDGSNRLGVSYTAHHLSGQGSIAGTQVRCIRPDVLVGFHTGYEIDANDWHDVRLLCERFDIPVPEIYAPFQKADSRG